MVGTWVGLSVQKYVLYIKLCDSSLDCQYTANNLNRVGN
jgi:hypothetical protein